MIYVRLLKNLAGSDGHIFLKDAEFWAWIECGIAVIRYVPKGGQMYRLRLQRGTYEVLIADPSFESNPAFGVKFSEKNVKGGES